MGDKSKGYVPLFRCVVDSWIFTEIDKHNIFSAWVDLLLMVNHKDAKAFVGGELIVIKRGQTITSIRKLSERWGWRKERTTKYLEALEKDGMITRERVKSGTLLTLVNYGFYNDVQDSIGTENGTETSHKAGQKRPTKRDESGTESGTKTDTNNNVNIINNGNNEKNENNENNVNKREGKTPRSRYGEYHHVLLTDEEHDKLLEQMGEHNTTDYIRRVDEYCEQKGKSYKNYYLTILNWWRRDDGEKKSNEDEDFRERIKRVWGRLDK